MAQFDAMQTGLEEVTVLYKPALFTCLRLDRATVPRGYHLYEVRDDGRGNAVQIGRHIAVNHWGSIITRDTIKLMPDGFLDIKSRDINHSTGDCRNMKAFMEKYPPKARPPKNHDCR